MNYHIDTGLIKEKFQTECDCPLCEIESVVTEQFLHEFLNDAVMEDDTRLKVNKSGFCDKHFDMLITRQNKLSVALQISTRVDRLKKNMTPPKNYGEAKKQAEELLKSQSTCVICDLVDESMEKYYKTVAQMYYKENDFYKILLKTKGFCLKHYALLLKYGNYAYGDKNDYVSLLSKIQTAHVNSLSDDLNGFCLKHDYRNALKPLGSAETALPKMRNFLYGKKLK